MLAALTVVIIGLLVLSVYGIVTWRSIEQHIAFDDRLQSHYERIQEMTSVIDYLTLVHGDLEIMEALAADALGLARELEAYDHALSRLAAMHLFEIGLMGDDLIENIPLLDQASDHLENHQAIQLLSRQVRIHHAGAREAMAALHNIHGRELRRQLNASIATLTLVALIFAFLIVVTSLFVQRRLSGPIWQIDQGMRRFQQGDLDARIDLDSNDELGRLAKSFNAMATTRQKYLRELSERIKEINCLYRVLELTSDTELDDDEIGKEIAQLIPISLMEPDLAVARVVLGTGQEHRSQNWSEPLVSICQEVMVDDQVVGLVEFGYRELPDWADSEENAFLVEKRDLIIGIALHLGRMIKHRRLAESLARSERLKAIGELTGGISHDFNNLLTVILGNAELLEEQLDGQEGARLARMITTAAQRGSELTQRLLAFARRQALDPRSINLNRMLTDMRDMLVRALGESIEIKLKQSEDLWPAMVDPSQLESALLNLCLNARDAMPEGGQLLLETENILLDADYAAEYEEVQPGAYVRLAVSDNGTGIEPEVLARVFEPFFTTKTEGTGLGLSMVFGLVKQSKGHIRVYSELGEGTSIHIYLPRADKTDQPEVIESDPVAQDTGRESILVVEDNDQVREYAAGRIRRWGYEVLEAASGGEALDIIRRVGKIDLLFTDVVMPGISGRQLAEKATAMIPGLKVLYTSGFTEDAIVMHGRLEPGVSLLTKPYRASELKHRLRKVLDDSLG